MPVLPCPHCGSRTVRKAPRACYPRDFVPLVYRRYVCDSCATVFDLPTSRAHMGLCVLLSAGLVILAGYEVARAVAAARVQVSTVVAAFAVIGGFDWLQAVVRGWRMKGPVILGQNQKRPE